MKIHTEVTISSAHFVQSSEGDCQRMHGHNFRVEIWIECEPARDSGMIADFKKIKECIKQYDHKILLPWEDKDYVQIKITKPPFDKSYLEEDWTNELLEELDYYRVIVNGKTQYILPRSDCILVPTTHITAEKLVRVFVSEILGDKRVNPLGGLRVKVRVWESDKSYAEAP